MKGRQWLTAIVTVEARVHARLMQDTMEAQSCRAQLRQWKGKDAQGYGRVDALVTQSWCARSWYE